MTLYTTSLLFHAVHKMSEKMFKRKLIKKVMVYFLTFQFKPLCVTTHVNKRSH